MKQWTGIELQRAQQGLEQAAAVVLGRMLFEFARLDMALGLALAWSGGGKELDKRTKEVESVSFHTKLDLLDSLSRALYGVGHSAHSLYTEWLRDAHMMRLIRNQLVHGRWGVDPMRDRVFNVIGLPTSPSQHETAYSISELKAILVQMEQLQQRLSKLREAWPV